MKPIKLTLQNFISYKRAEVDFEAIGQRLYLISGKTGAGKTTIFDGMMYALYGKVSGSNRDEKMLHSDFAAAGENTVVTLDFIENDKKYHITRTIPMVKDRKTGSYNQGTSRAELTGDGMAPIEGKTNVDARITELLHMNADQFKQIVMLAQGEFRRFLDANSKDRLQILRTLFSTSHYERFQSILSSAAKKLNQENEDLNKLLSNTMQDFFLMPEGLSEQEEAGFQAEHPLLKEHLLDLIAQETDELSRLEEGVQQAEAHRIELVTKQATCLHQNEALDKLARALETQKALDIRKPQQEALAQAYEAAERAIHQVMPHEKQADSKQKESAQAARDRDLTAGAARSAAEKLKTADAALEAACSKQPDIDRMKRQLDDLARVMPFYHDRTRYQQDLKGEQKKLKDMHQESARLEKAIETDEARLQEISGLLVRLEGIDGQVVEKKSECDKLAELIRKLKTISLQIDGLKTDEVKVSGLHSDLEQKTRNAGNAKSVYDDLYTRFLRNQAGLLGIELENTIAAKGSGDCPVCRTHFTAGSCSFARPEEGAPDQAAVDKAKEHFDSAENMRSKAATTYSTSASTLEANIRNLLDTATELQMQLGWEQLPQAIISRLAEAKQQAEVLKAELAALTGQQLQRTDLINEQKQLTSIVRENSKLKEGLAGDQADVDSQIKLLNERISKLNAELRFDTQAEAEAELHAIQTKVDELTAAIQQAEKAQKQIKTECDGLEGKLSEQHSRCVQLSQEATNALEAYQQAIIDAHFDDEGHYRAALVPLNGTDPESWLKRAQQTMQSYTSDVQLNQVDIANRRKETAGYTYTDTAVLEQQLADANNRQKQANDARDKVKAALENHQRTMEKVSRILSQKAALAPALERLKKLSTLANGPDKSAGRLSFENYVLSVSFREILQAANERLMVTSGGRYRLVQPQAGSDTGNGLDMEIVDNLNDHTRKTGSISGGEGFQVSMALALGLSDVVQNHAGGIRIESMFIDEGFGSLDSELLQKAIQMLDRLAGANRQIGIISHVTELDESISPKLVVTSGSDGSHLKLVD